MKIYWVSLLIGLSYLRWVDSLEDLDLTGIMHGEKRHSLSSTSSLLVNLTLIRGAAAAGAGIYNSFFFFTNFL